MYTHKKQRAQSVATFRRTVQCLRPSSAHFGARGRRRPRQRQPLAYAGCDVAALAAPAGVAARGLPAERALVVAGDGGTRAGRVLELLLLLRLPSRLGVSLVGCGGARLCPVFLH